MTEVEMLLYLTALS